VVSNDGAAPALVFQVTASEVQLIEFASPSSIISVMLWPLFHVPEVGVLAPDKAQVWIDPFVGDKAGVVPVTAKTSSV
jgi:hypothetical protein